MNPMHPNAHKTFVGSLLCIKWTWFHLLFCVSTKLQFLYKIRVCILYVVAEQGKPVEEKLNKFRQMYSKLRTEHVQLLRMVRSST